MASDLHQGVESVKDAAFVSFKLGAAIDIMGDALAGGTVHGEQLRRAISDVKLIREGELMRGRSAAIQLFGEANNGR